MQLISCHDGKLLTLSADHAPATGAGGFATGLPALDALLPGGVFARGAVHELLTEPENGHALSFAMLLARAAILEEEKEHPFTPHSRIHSPTLILCDPAGRIYPPALAAMGISPRQVYLLRPRNAAEQVWAVAECLRCKGVGAVVASPAKLSRTEARKLQLSAERGGGIGLLLRTVGQSPHYAAATRWLIQPAPGQRTVQRWNIQLIHGPGANVGQGVVLELSRENSRMNAFKLSEIQRKVEEPRFVRAS